MVHLGMFTSVPVSFRLTSISEHMVRPSRRRLTHETWKNLQRRPTPAVHKLWENLRVGWPMNYVSHCRSMAATLSTEAVALDQNFDVEALEVDDDGKHGKCREK
jgi:hypothetical protein